MAINVKRTAAMKSKSNEELQEIVKSGSLSSAAAAYELRRRSK